MHVILVINYKRICVLQVQNNKLVSDDGIIRPEIFYKALTTWIKEDFLGYQFSQVCFVVTLQESEPSISCV